MLPIREIFNISNQTDLHQWVIDYENFVQIVSQNIKQIKLYSNVEYEKQQAREYQQQVTSLQRQLNRCQAAIAAFNRMPSLKTFVTDTVEANIQCISYYFRWMHHSGEFESLGIDEVGVYAIRSVDNRLVRVYEMSTGQRTSLAFSVMLAFYSVADTAPKCLLLDELLATMDTRMYSGVDPEFIEGDVFRTIIPLPEIATATVGPASTISNDELIKEQVVEQAGEQAESKEQLILDFCTVPRTRKEIQGHINVAGRRYFLEAYLKPLLECGKLRMTIQEKPNSPKQKYIKI